MSRGSATPLDSRSRLDMLEREVQSLRDRLTAVSPQRQPRVNPPMTGMWIGKVDGSGISAGSGATPGSGSVELYWRGAAGDVEALGETVVVFNRSSAVAADAWVTVAKDVYGTFWIVDHSGKLWRYALDERMGATTSGEAAASLLELDGTDTGSTVQILDNAGLYSELQSGHVGYCVEFDGQYHPVQQRPTTFVAVAPSGGLPAISGDTPGSEVCTIYKLSGSDLLTFSVAVTVRNVGSAIAEGTYFLVHQDQDDTWWAKGPAAGPTAWHADNGTESFSSATAVESFWNERVSAAGFPFSFDDTTGIVTFSEAGWFRVHYQLAVTVSSGGGTLSAHEWWRTVMRLDDGGGFANITAPRTFIFGVAIEGMTSNMNMTHSMEFVKEFSAGDKIQIWAENFGGSTTLRVQDAAMTIQPLSQ